MNSISRFAGRIGSALLILALLQSGFACAQSAPYLFQNRPLAFSHVSNAAGTPAVGINDPGLRDLLRQLGATLTWRPGERYVLITTMQPQVVRFSVGDMSFSVGPITAQASFAPFLVGAEVYLPLQDVMRALYLAPIRDGNVTVLQPQLSSVDLQGSGTQAVLVARGATALRPRVASESADRIVYEFDGVGSMLSSRAFNVGGIRAIDVNTSGTTRYPKTFVTVSIQPGTRHDVPHSNNGDFEVGFGENGPPPLVAASNAAQSPAQTAEVESPAPMQSPSASPESIATVSTVSVESTNAGATVTISVSGNATYEWHRLRDPDNRFWIDIKGAQLAGGARDEDETDPLISMRVRQNDAQTVRVALSLNGEKSIGVLPSATGVTIAVGTEEVAADAPRMGDGSIGGVVSANEPQTAITPVPPDEYGASNDNSDTYWKFGPHSYVPANPRLIIIDPGHGGGDRGAIRNGLTEAEVNLDVANRLRVLLVARGWQVQMTRDGDSDVPATPASAAEAEKMGYKSHDAADLQARDDIANASGARLFISIHSNSYINSGPVGTTVYYSKPNDVPFAETIDRTLPPRLGTKDDGTVKSKLYVTLHANMPAVLVEMAFLSNPDDFAKLASPAWRQKVAVAMADGIDAYAQANPVSTGGNL